MVRRKGANKTIVSVSKPMSDTELTALIKEAEKGPFNSSEQVKERLKKLTKSYANRAQII